MYYIMHWKSATIQLMYWIHQIWAACKSYALFITWSLLTDIGLFPTTTKMVLIIFVYKASMKSNYIYISKCYIYTYFP